MWATLNCEHPNHGRLQGRIPTTEDYREGYPPRKTTAKDHDHRRVHLFLYVYCSNFERGNIFFKSFFFTLVLNKLFQCIILSLEIFLLCKLPLTMRFPYYFFISTRHDSFRYYLFNTEYKSLITLQLAISRKLPLPFRMFLRRRCTFEVIFHYLYYSKKKFFKEVFCTMDLMNSAH